ncbi:MAG: CHASE4 domain-containing protein [Planctomycetota bacterium]
MSYLRRRILLLLSGVAAALLLMAWWIQERELLPSFLELEHQQATADLQRGTEALQNEVGFVGDYVSDWSGWDDTYRFVEDRNPEFVESNLATGVFRETSFDFLSMVRLDGVEVWRGCEIDGVAVELSSLPSGSWPLTHALLAPRELDAVAMGTMVTAHGPMLVASRPITDSARTAPQRGWILMGRFLSPVRLAKLRKQTRLDLSILPVSGIGDEQRLAACERLRSVTEEVTFDDEVVVARQRRRGLRGPQDALLVEVQLPRAILTEGRRALAFAQAATVVAVFLLFAVLATILQRVVVGPLQRLTKHVLAIRASGDLTARSGIQRGDEVGLLAREFDGLVERLADLQSAQVQRARAGGMAEVARSVLHDVGNALQPVQGNLGLLKRHLGSRSASDLERVSSLLEAHEHDLGEWVATDSKGRQLPTFLKALARSIRSEHEAALQEIDNLAKGVDHIQHLVDRQNVHRDAHGAIETVRAEALVAQALRMSTGESDDGITFLPDVEVEAPLAVEKHKLLAVLINLLRNAHQASLGMPAERRTVRIRVRETDGGTVRFTVEDQGVGIAEENLTRIFEGGFTTKQAQHGQGLGLHGCANSMAEMGGRMWAESEGVGRGARFHVELPLIAEARDRADLELAGTGAAR